MARYEFSTHRLFVEAPLAPEARIPLTPEAFNYLAHVLRMPEGGRLMVFNSRDGEFEATFHLLGRKAGAVRLRVQTRLQDRPGRITLAFAPLKSARLEYLVQKAVEMGAARMVPVLTRRTQMRGLKPEKLRAWAIEAAEQCGILSLPEIAPEMTLDAFLDLQATDSVLIFCDEEAQTSDPVAVLRQVDPAGPLTLLIGPEGGFDESERLRLLARKNVIRLSLGPRILRADTAAVAGLAALQIALGDWRAD
ncbi:MAG: 16S rRNA (uracil(1498)-N(3))-methyltransferase [Methylobacterium sp.]|jgi:16S rRNA (uracil1498-N3)-methyltransferase|nr:16S rRNA (uracil(1498)-N(3))-methyltransferase [Methylobacterium sp.]MCA3597153.1 16S rRNA (uracil(1498)-N(3))-methyltransferase [Methylobacterium sp.]MCA3602431.1 16S rRNA (uracil(1498)-N(3))-methyltransferase [Methylobacterium sp.]MCA3605684.1 16S rRNA (uracil(1498)-N(3))-methyltransferase [Methylobacterium sp.]MCA3608326.1 16S rRNA (uracil(1498)-N(3))-methyltransferase [Methylobacterium sp.]